VAIYHATGDLANGIATVIGGCIYDYIAAEKTAATGFYTQIFLIGMVSRILAVPLLARLIEPHARRVRDLRL
jgi:predicted MFS family arabinose efflux permease